MLWRRWNFNTGKCEALLLGWANPLQLKLRTDWLESSFVGKSLGVLLSDTLRMS